MEENLKQSQAADIIKIAIVGPESTGKTTLAAQLAEHFQTVWTPEFARGYLQQKWDETRTICEPHDQLILASGQTQLENQQVEKANGILISDTSVLQTKVYSEIYFNHCDVAIAKAAKKHKYDLFLLTATDVPWEKDDLRDKPNNRQEIFELFKQSLEELGKPYLVLSGSKEHRLARAINVISELCVARKNNFTSFEFLSIVDSGISVTSILSQIAIFKNGIAKSVLDRPAVPGDGIRVLSDGEFKDYAESFNRRKPSLVLQKFIPASGAASRMFKFLSEFLNEYDLQRESINAYINRKKASELTVFLAGLEKMPFFDSVIKSLTVKDPDFNSWDRSKKVYHFIKTLLEAEDFKYSDLPKGVLPFHRYKSHIATPVEEHLTETIYYATGKNHKASLHFTVSDSHQILFEKIIDRVRPKIEKQSGFKIDVTFSFQDKSTDTIAVDIDNEPLREGDSLVFRPGGHGALINNLSKLDADVIFIKNIDNVIQDHVVEIALYKNALGGILIETQDGIFKCLDMLDNAAAAGNTVEEVSLYIQEKLNIAIPADFEKYTSQSQIDYLREVLDRPVRICGMVKNEGEPGGGPFWVRDKSGKVSLQIVESSQVDLENPQQAEILSQSTHFNPVDIVCSIKNHRNEKFDLAKYIDPNSGFIVDKNKNGKPIKGYELPGLWNGAMANWITLFVEVPLITFNPVKTVNDLLKAAHQP